MAQDTIKQAMKTAVEHHQAGRLAQARAIYLEVLALDPCLADPLDLLGVIAIQTGKFDQAIGWIRQAIAINPRVASYHSHLGNAFRGKNQHDEAIAAWRVALDLNGDFAEAYVNLGNALREKGQLKEAVEACRNAVRLNPGSFEGLTNLGAALQETGQSDEAIAAFRQALRINPNVAEIHNNLGNALAGKGQLDEAIAEFHRAIELKPDSAEIHHNLGGTLCKQGRFDEAIAAHRQALDLKPDYAEAYSSLAVTLNQMGRPDEAIAACRQAMRLKPRYAEAHYNLGIAFKETGQLDEAIACYRQAIQLKPGLVRVHDNLLYALAFHPGYDGRMICEEHRRWSQQFAEPLAVKGEPSTPEIRSHDNDRSPDRKLKIGFLSPDFGDHPAGRSLLPLFENRDPGHLEIVCYASVQTGDLITAKLKSLADQWHDVPAMSDERVAEKIRHDRIDILVDTALHTAHNRLLVFAREPAPVQLTMLGPPMTTGLSKMHYRLTDPYLDPPGAAEGFASAAEGFASASDGDYTETSIRLPHCFWIYQPPPIGTLPNDLPALISGFVTFSCLNQFSKVTRPALELWVRILQSVPKSRLTIQSQPGVHLDIVRKLFHDGGISPDRVQFVAKTSQEEYFRRYHQLDICLDPFPFNGHTSSMDALWMGVPSVALRGRTAVGRGGVSILSNVGLTDWIADTPEQYVSVAAQMAGDLPRLAELRRTLRTRMQASPLMDAPRFARDVEAAWRQMWRNWCQRGGLTLHHGGNSSLQCPAR
jgi:predicted O-linked N-acetylglucosamine transferase (SPINDLY family)